MAHISCANLISCKINLMQNSSEQKVMTLDFIQINSVVRKRQLFCRAWNFSKNRPFRKVLKCAAAHEKYEYEFYGTSEDKRDIV